jgi:hypothetical protein
MVAAMMPIAAQALPGLIAPARCLDDRPASFRLGRCDRGRLLDLQSLGALARSGQRLHEDRHGLGRGL